MEKGKWKIKNDSRKAETIQENCYACNKTSNLFEEVILLVTKCRLYALFYVLPLGPSSTEREMIAQCALATNKNGFIEQKRERIVMPYWLANDFKLYFINRTD